jgi:uncharacterized phage protein (TIGR01671 family)
MRPIEFRGLRSDGQGWVYGDLAHDAFDGTSKMIPVGIRNKNSYPIEILPETVGQFTGLTDKNGVKIFEGDKVMNEEGEILIISYQLNGFTMLTSYGQRLKGILGDSMDWFFKVEVIGNIHETTEGGNNG